MTNKSLEDIARESQLVLWQAYCDMKMELEAANDEIERLQSIIRNIVDTYDKEVFMRSADFHRLDCDCLRCAVDAGRKV